MEEQEVCDGRPFSFAKSFQKERVPNKHHKDKPLSNRKIKSTK